MAVPLVGLTGGLGAGKSTALAELELLGAAVLSADAVVHELYGTKEVADAVRERFGDSVFAADAGTIAGTLESRVGCTRAFFRIVEENTLQIFVQFEKIQFT